MHLVWLPCFPGLQITCMHRDGQAWLSQKTAVVHGGYMVHATVLTSLERDPHAVLCFGSLEESTKLIEEAASVSLNHMTQC